MCFMKYNERVTEASARHHLSFACVYVLMKLQPDSYHISTVCSIFFLPVLIFFNLPDF